MPIGDKGFAREMPELKITFVRPDRCHETHRHGNLTLIPVGGRDPAQLGH